MAYKRKPITKLQQFLDEFITLYAHCADQQHCRHYSQLNLDLLTKHLGADYDFYENRERFQRRLVCSKCGARGPSFIIIPHSRWNAEYAIETGDTKMTPKRAMEITKVMNERASRGKIDPI